MATCQKIFTFQSGYIQITLTPSIIIHKNSFTFQSGYIQIRRMAEGLRSL